MAKLRLNFNILFAFRSKYHMVFNFSCKRADYILTASFTPFMVLIFLIRAESEALALSVTTTKPQKSPSLESMDMLRSPMPSSLSMIDVMFVTMPMFVFSDNA